MIYIRAIVLTEQFALDNDGETNDRNVFSYFMTYEGGYYCNENYTVTNPAIFISIYMMVAIISGVISALGMWFNLKGRVDMYKSDIMNLKTEVLNDRAELTALKDVVEKNKEKTADTMFILKEEMSQMEIRIIKEIHSLAKLK
jgi:hypothetical protein